MFDLEKAIANWRQKLDRGRAFFDDDVEELDGHLRDLIASLVEAGASESDAFHTAVKRFGPYGRVEAEYRKVRWTKVRQRGGFLPELTNRTMMLANYFKLAFRTLKRHKAYTAINVFGLAVGMACCLLLLLYVQHQLAFDNFHADAELIYRLGRGSAYEDGGRRSANTGAAAAPALKTEFPGVESTVRIMPSYPRSMLVRNEDVRFYETTFFWADSTVFDVFSFPLRRGDPSSALVEPFSVVITEDMARRYFGDDDPMGKTLTAHHWTTTEYTVTGILEDIPATSHLRFDFLASMTGEEPRYAFMFDGEDAWANSLVYTYIKFANEQAVETTAPQLAAFADRHMGVYAASRGFVPDFFLQPLRDIHLRSDLANDIAITGDIRYVYLFSAIALLILFIACINFMNLATARASERAREVGLRKVMGAHRGQIVRQFLSESVLLTLIALVIAVGLLILFLPVFPRLFGTMVLFDSDSVRWLVVGLIGVSVLVGFAAGSYPAVYLSSFKPIGMLRGAFKTSRAGVRLRKGLVVVQFVISIVLIASTLVIVSQLDYLRSKPLGFDREQIVVIPLNDDALRENLEAIKVDLARHPGVVSLSAAAGTPGNQGLIDRFPIRAADAPETDQRAMYVIGADPDYVEVLGLTLVEGRNLSADFPTDATEAFIINETAARMLGWRDPIGREIIVNEGSGKRGTVVGVVRDFHFQSLHLPVEPALIRVWPDRYRMLSVKIRPDNVPETIAFLERRWLDYAPEQPFAFTFLDEDYERLYKSEARLSSIFGSFSLLAIVLACLGLFGLAAYTTQQRTKEIGVRKVLGASVAGIVALLSRDFLKLVTLAFLVAAPVAYILGDRWLDSFAYRVHVGVGTVLLAGAVAFVIAFITVVYQAVQAAAMKPARSLRFE